MSEPEHVPDAVVVPDDDPAVRYGDLWGKGNPPDIAAFLARAGRLTLAQAASVLSVDQWQRWQLGDRIPAETHIKMYPGLAGTVEAFDLVYGEFLLREEMGEEPTREEYLKRFPEFAVQIKRQFLLHKVVESGLGEEDEPARPAPKASQDNTPNSVVVYEAATPGGSGTAGNFEKPIIPGYEILSQIGRGGMGVVYKARQERLKRICALKVIHKDRLFQSPEAIPRFQREAQASAQLHHPNVVVVYDFNQNGDTYYLAMEFVEGTDLHLLVKDAGPLPIETACDYIRQAALGLQHAFERGMVHRDIKPSNLLVTMPRLKQAAPPKEKTPGATPSGAPIRPLGLSYMGTTEVGVVKILDMGLALFAHAPDTQSANWTQEGTLMGTPDFIAPEQAVNSHAVDIRADLYSLGCTLYYLLTGKAPFGEFPLIKKLMMHQVQPPRPVEELRPEVPPAVSAIVKKLLAKTPDERYQTPAELAQALAAVHGRTTSTPSSARPPASTTPPGPAAPAVGAPTQHAPKAPSTGPKRSDTMFTLSLPPRPTPREPELPPGVQKPQKVAKLAGHRGWVTSVTFAPDRSMLASGGVDGSLRLWDLAGVEPQDRAIPNAHTSDLNAMVFSPNNKILASGSGTLDGVICLWDHSGEKPRQVGVVHTKNCTVDALAFSPDSRLLAVGGSDRQVRVWDVSGPAPVSKGALKGHTDHVKVLAFGADGQTLLSGSQDGTLRVWNLSRFWSKEQAVLQGDWGAVLTLALAPDDSALAFGSLDSAVRLWDTSGTSLAQRGLLQGHTGIVRMVHFNPDSKSLVSVCDGGRVIRWDTATGAKQREWQMPRNKVHRCVSITRDGRYLASGTSDGTVYIFRLYPKNDETGGKSESDKLPTV